MRFIALALLLVIAVIAGVTVGVDPSSLTYYSYGYQSPVNPPLGAAFQINFPNQAIGGQLSIPACSTYSNLKYNHYTYNSGPSTWTGPASGPVYGYFTNFYASVNPSQNWQGFQADISMQGQIAANTNPSTQTMVQSFYFSTDNCYEYGPEYGFYRLLSDPTDISALTTVYFYYGLNVNCYNVGALGSCRDKVSGQSLQYNVVAIPLTLPRTNSRGGTNFRYRVQLTRLFTTYQWVIDIDDPYTFNSIIFQSVNIDPAGFFASTADHLYNNGLSGYFTATQQRNSIQGGITENMSNPLRTIVNSIAKITLASVIITPVFGGMQSSTGWCMQGAQGIYAPTQYGSSPTQRSMQRSYPACTVTVYNTGTTTPAQLYSNNSVSPTPLPNPFQATTNGFYQFYAANGTYDVQLSGGGLAAPVLVGSVELFDFSTWLPTSLSTNKLALTLPSNTAVYAGLVPSPNMVTAYTWTWPSVDSPGCLTSDGFGAMSFTGCSASGGDKSVQYNKNGQFGSDTNFTWDYTARLLTLSGTGGSPTLTVNTGFILAGGGVVSNANSWQGFNTNTDGALLRGLSIGANQDATAGGYLNMSALGYGNTPLPLSGLSSFGAHTGLLWVSGTNGMSPDTTVAWNTNLYVNAAGGFNTANTPFNSIQAQQGGALANSFTAISYVQTGHHNGAPSVTLNDAFHQGALYWDDGLGSEQVYNGTNWVTLAGGGGGGGTPAGPTKAIQYNAGGGNFGGSANFEWDNGSQYAVATASASNTAGVVVLTGFAQAENGFLAQNVGAPTTALNYNVIQAPHGGMAALSFTAVNYIQTGSSSGVPALTTSDAFHAGAMYWDTGSAAEKVYNGAAWISLGGGAGSPGGANTNVQFNSAGAFGGSSNFTYNSGTQLLTVVATGAGVAGMAVQTGYMQADAGFLATPGTALNYNAIQATGGGMAAKSFTALNYIQSGNATATPTLTANDAFNAGAMYYNTISACEEVYSGSTWSCLGTGGATTPGGSNTNVQFNNAGNFGGSNNFNWNNSSQLLSVIGVPSTAGIAVANGYIQSDGGFLVNTSNQYNSIHTTSLGGMAARSFTATAYVQTGNSSGVPSITSSDSFNPGAMFWDTSVGVEKVFNGSSWLSIATSGTGVLSLNSLTGALSIVGTTNEITVAPSGTTITLATPQPIAVSSNVQFASVTAGPFQSTATGGSVAFQTTNFAFQVDGTGNISAQGALNLTGGSSAYKMGGTTFVDVSRNGTFASLTTTGGGVIQSSATSTSPSFQNTNFNFQVNGNGDISGQGSLNMGGGSSTYKLGGTTIVDASRNSTFASVTTSGGGVVQSSATGASAAFQTTNFNFQVNGNGAISGQQLNIGGTQVFDSSRNLTNAGSGTFSSAVALNGGLTTPNGTNSNLYIGTGNLYLRVPGASSGISCFGVTDGWTAITSDQYVVSCVGGARYRGALSAY